jgi:hypothetical protein
MAFQIKLYLLESRMIVFIKLSGNFRLARFLAIKVWYPFHRCVYA